MQLLRLVSLFFISLALGSPSDVIYIEKLVADEAHLLDAKDFRGLAKFFTKNATYNGGESPNVYGIESIQTKLASILGPDFVTQNAISTESITLLPPFDEQGAAGTATGLLDITVAFIGQGNLTGEALIYSANYKDKYVKTQDFAHYGGWKISERFFVTIGITGNKNIYPLAFAMD